MNTTQDKLSPISRQLCDGLYYWKTIQADLNNVPTWESLFRRPVAGITDFDTYIGSYKAEYQTFTRSYVYHVRLSSHDGGDSRSATFQTAKLARHCIESHALLQANDSTLIKP